MQTDFTHRQLRTVDKPVHRLGLALNMGIDADGVSAAFDRGVGYVFYTRLRTGKSLSVLRDALKRDREKYVVAAGPSFAFYRGNVRRAAESTLKKLGIDCIDVFQLMWLGTATAWTDGIVDELVKLRDEGKVRALGISIHDRERAGRPVAVAIGRADFQGLGRRPPSGAAHSDPVASQVFDFQRQE